MEKRVIIIGAGIAGLCAGIYARMNGYAVTIFELHDKPGGLCTSWQRKGYTVDGCVHWLVGSGPGNGPANGLYQIWSELGVLDRKFVDHEEFARVVDPSGKTLILYTDIDRLERHLLELAPADAAVIREFTAAVRKFALMPMPIGKPRELRSLLDSIGGLLKMAPFIPGFLKWTRLPVRKFAERFTDPFLRRAFPVFFDLPDFPMIGMIFTLAWMHTRTSGYPIGGSLEFARGIEKRFLDLGGEIRYRARVQKILTESGRAVGVRLADGSEHRADMVISAADGHATIFEMLEGKYLSDEIRGYYDRLPKFGALIQVSLGIARDLSAEPAFTLNLAEKPMEVAGEKIEVMPVHIYSYDPTLAPPGKSVVVARFFGDYRRWKELRKNPEAYEAEKQKLGDFMIGYMESRFPGISEQVEMVDVATPTTFERYTGNWEGSMEGWLITTKSIMMKIKRTLPGLDNFYMIGQWVSPGGGLPSGAITGREAIQVLCHHDGKEFRASAP